MLKGASKRAPTTTRKARSVRSKRSWRRTSCCSVGTQAATPTATVEAGEKDPHIVLPQASPRMVTTIAHRHPQNRTCKTTMYRSKMGTRAQVESDYWV